MRNIKSYIISLAIMISAGGALFALTMPQTVSAVEPTCSQGFLLMPTWYRGLVDDGCNVKIPEEAAGGLRTFIWTIVLNVLEMGLWAAGYISAAFIIYGGISYILTQGVVEGAIKARTMILNAIIGLLISLISASIVGFIVTKVIPSGGPTKATDPTEVLNGILNLVYMVSGAFAVIIVILAGFSYTTAQGEPDKIAKAKKAIMYAVIGLVIIGMAFAITGFVIGKF